MTMHVFCFQIFRWSWTNVARVLDRRTNEHSNLKENPTVCLSSRLADYADISRARFTTENYLDKVYSI
jgi:hypothetical protein